MRARVAVMVVVISAHSARGARRRDAESEHYRSALLCLLVAVDLYRCCAFVVTGEPARVRVRCVCRGWDSFELGVPPFTDTRVADGWRRPRGRVAFRHGR